MRGQLAEVFGNQSATGATGVFETLAAGDSSAPMDNADTATSTIPTEDASIEAAGLQHHHAEEEEDDTGDQPRQLEQGIDHKEGPLALNVRQGEVRGTECMGH